MDFLLAGASVFLFKERISALLPPLNQKSNRLLAISAIGTLALTSISAGNLGILSVMHVLVGGSLQVVAISTIIHLLANAKMKDPWNLLDSKPMVTVGLSSYSIYVVQQACFYSLPGTTIDKDFLYFASIPVALVIGVATFYVLERPANRYLRKKWLKKAAGLEHSASIAATVAFDDRAA